MATRPARLLSASLALLLVPDARLLAAADPSPLPAVEGWTLSPGPRSFGPATLYEHVDGASELYLSYEFRELVVAEYRKGEASITVERYRHGSPAHAFGIYSQERPLEGRYLALGAEAYLDPPVLYLLAGDCYLKLTAEGPGTAAEETLLDFARRLDASLPGARRLPEALDFFPEEGRVPHGERFAAKDLLGYAFLGAGFTADYEIGEARFQLFVATAKSVAEAEAMLRRYRESAATPSAAAAAFEVVADPYNGEVAVFRKGRHLCGALRLAAGAVRERSLDALRRRVPD